MPTHKVHTYFHMGINSKLYGSYQVEMQQLQLYKWLDDVAMSGKVCADNVTRTKDGNREKGWFHKLKLNDAFSFEED